MFKITWRDLLLVLVTVGAGFAACTTGQRVKVESVEDKFCAERAQVKAIEAILDAGTE